MSGLPVNYPARSSRAPSPSAAKPEGPGRASPRPPAVNGTAGDWVDDYHDRREVERENAAIYCITRALVICAGVGAALLLAQCVGWIQ